ncbi:hypothetical protein [Nonomuraea sp. SYSU D8015]|nr:hypothetical protein [Nonomuraea sp. SYSU D8015]
MTITWSGYGKRRGVHAAVSWCTPAFAEPAEVRWNISLIVAEARYIGF